MSEGKLAKYSKKDHMDWVDQSNLGVSHFGIHPESLRPDLLRFDTFHMKCAITRNLINYTRMFINQVSSFEKRREFYNVLSRFWNTYHIHVWNSKCNFSSFKGNELALFVANTEYLCEFLERGLSETP